MHTDTHTQKKVTFIKKCCSHIQ